MAMALLIEALASSVYGEIGRQFAKTIVTLKDSTLLEQLEKDPEAKSAIEKFSLEPSKENLEKIDHRIKEISDDDPTFLRAVNLLTCLQGLRRQAAKLIPLEEYLSYLYNLRQPSLIYSGFSLAIMRDSIINFLSIKPDPTKEIRETLHKDHVFNEEINGVECQVRNSLITSTLSPNKELDFKNKIDSLQNKLLLFESRLNTLYLSSLNPVLACDELVNNLSSKIGHKDLRAEAEMHVNVVKGLVDQLNKTYDLQDHTFGVFNPETPRMISSMVDIEKRRVMVEKLIKEDWRRNKCTTTFVIFYIVIFLAVLIFSIGQGVRYQVGATPMKDLILPLIGIPWPVILWSLIGSFASMLYRFNSKQIPDFGNTIKWLITRPVQGVVLGSAFYLVLMSGLFLLTGETSANAENSSPVKDEVILVLSFLVGFSDRFADSIFNALVANFSKDYGQDNNQSEGSNSKP